LATPSAKELSRRHTHNAEFKARVAMEETRCCKTIQQIVADHVKSVVLCSALCGVT
jgi:hypothetical protein